MDWVEPPDSCVWIGLGCQRKWFLFDAQEYSLTEPLQICDKMMVADDGKSFPKKSWYGNLEVVGVHGMSLSKECCPTQK